MDGYKKITKSMCLLLISVTQTHTMNLQQLNLLGRNMCRTRTSRIMRNRLLNKRRNKSCANSSLMQNQQFLTPRVSMHQAEITAQPTTKKTSWWSNLRHVWNNLFAPQTTQYPYAQTEKWNKKTDSSKSSHYQKQNQALYIAAAFLGGGIIAKMQQKSRVVYADACDKPIEIAPFTIAKEEMANPDLMRAKLAQYDEEHHPHVAVQIIEYLKTYLCFSWSWALKQAIHQAPESVKIIVDFVAPHSAHVANTSAACAPVVAFLMKENPKLIEPIKTEIEQNKEIFEQTKHGKKVMKVLGIN